MGNLYDALIELGYDDDDPSTEIDLDRDVPDGPLDDDLDEMERWVDSVIWEPEYLGAR